MPAAFLTTCLAWRAKVKLHPGLQLRTELSAFGKSKLHRDAKPPPGTENRLQLLTEQMDGSGMSILTLRIP